MSANIDTMIHVGQLPWHGLSKDMTENPPSNGFEIVAAADLNWEVDYMKMYTDIHPSVQNYKAIYRCDNREVLGVVNKSTPLLVQNTTTFDVVDKLIGNELKVETAASIDRGSTVFGCFKISEQFKIFDDDIDHYFVIVNEHLRPDGKLTVLNTPVRVVCQNTLSEAIGNNLYKVRIPAYCDVATASATCNNLIYGVRDLITALKKKADDMFSKKITKKYVDDLLDILFPYKIVDELDQRGIAANEKIASIRSSFLNSCMAADDLQNYRGTQWQVFNALVDWDQHYFKTVDSAYNLNKRMKLLPGMVQASEPSATSKFLKVANKLVA